MTASPITDDTLFGGGNLGHAVAVVADGSRIMAGAPEWGGGVGKAMVLDWNATASEWSKVWEMAGGNTAGKYGSSVVFLNSETFAVGEPGALSGNGAVHVYQEDLDSASGFRKIGAIQGADGAALGKSGTVSGSTSESGVLSLLVASADGAVHRYDYSNGNFEMPIPSVSGLGGAVTSVSMGSSGDAFVVGVSSANTASIYDA
jgi:hypothetical protein